MVQFDNFQKKDSDLVKQFTKKWTSTTISPLLWKLWTLLNNLKNLFLGADPQGLFSRDLWSWLKKKARCCKLCFMIWRYFLGQHFLSWRSSFKEDILSSVMFAVLLWLYMNAAMLKEQRIRRTMITSRIPLIDQFTRAAQHEKHSGHLELVKASWMDASGFNIQCRIRWSNWSNAVQMVKLVKYNADGAELSSLLLYWALIRRANSAPLLAWHTTTPTTTGRAHSYSISQQLGQWTRTL